MHDLDEAPTLDKYKRHTIEVVVDRSSCATPTPEGAVRGADGRPIDPETGAPDPGSEPRASPTPSRRRCAWARASWSSPRRATASRPAFEEQRYSEKYSCPYDGFTIDELEPRCFSFNSPHGACPACTGLGCAGVRPRAGHPGPLESLAQGALVPWAQMPTDASWSAEDRRGRRQVARLGLPARRSGSCRRRPSTTCSTPPQDEKVASATATSAARTRTRRTFEGLVPNLERRYRETDSEWVKTELEKYMVSRPCPTCGGQRLKPEALARHHRRSEHLRGREPCRSPTRSRWADRAARPDSRERERTIARQVLKEIVARLGFLVDVGLDYLTVDRTSSTLSGGEAQRIRLATQIGSTLMGVLYILDEPTIGLHQKDNAKLIATLIRLRDLGNTLIVVEHDEETIRTADWVLDIGPGAGEHGGEVIANGPLEDGARASRARSPARTCAASGAVPIPPERRKGNGKALVVRGAREHNLKDIDVRVPARDVRRRDRRVGLGQEHARDRDPLPRAGARAQRSREPVGAHDALEGVEHVDKVIEIDQSPIGRTPRSNPATYVGLFTPIRELFAGVPEARVRGYGPGRFSFNVKGGRCENCKGDGIIKIEMQFLPDVYVPCEVCHGKRYNREALEIHYKGRSIADVLEMTVEEALEFFAPCRPSGRSSRRWSTSGSATCASASRRRRCRAARRSASSWRPSCPGGPPARRSTCSTSRRPGSTSPTSRSCSRSSTGSSTRGNTVIVIEHNLDVIKTADWIIDLGPGGRRRAAARSSPRARPRRSRRQRVRRPASTSPACSAASRSSRSATSRSPRRPAARLCRSRP